jgi:hypothetical protein
MEAIVDDGIWGNDVVLRAVVIGVLEWILSRHTPIEGLMYVMDGSGSPRTSPLSIGA